ncbi:MAG: hypothetical protein K9M75_13005, partial [Phycisphaerae bacterium]|nr:hypothetical protein [Phycisphaerae bacterium]
LTPKEYNNGVELLAGCVSEVEGVSDNFVDDLLALGIISVLDLEEVGTGPLVEELGVEKDLAAKLVLAAAEKAKLLAAEKKKKQAESILDAGKGESLD